MTFLVGDKDLLINIWLNNLLIIVQHYGSFLISREIFCSIGSNKFFSVCENDFWQNKNFDWHEQIGKKHFLLLHWRKLFFFLEVNINRLSCDLANITSFTGSIYVESVWKRGRLYYRVNFLTTNDFTKEKKSLIFETNYFTWIKNWTFQIEDFSWP